jgi:hypothetical protein
MIRNRTNAMAHVAREQQKRTEVVATKTVNVIGSGKAVYPIFSGTPFKEGTKREIKNGRTVITTIEAKVKR